MTQRILILISNLLLFGQIYCQKAKINLDGKVFKNSIANSAWSLEDTTKKKAEEIFLISFKNSVLSIAYIDWIEGMHGSDTKYKLAFKDSIMEITPISWKMRKGSKKTNKNSPFFIYCYLVSNDKIAVLFKDQKSELSRKLLDDKDWFELIKFEK